MQCGMVWCIWNLSLSRTSPAEVTRGSRSQAARISLIAASVGLASQRGGVIMRKGLAVLILTIVAGALSAGTIDLPECGYDDPTIVCYTYCNNYDAMCWGPAQPPEACVDFANGCASSPNDCCNFEGGL